MMTNRVAIAGLAALAFAILCGVLLLRGEPQETATAPAPGQVTASKDRDRPEDDSTQRDLVARYSEARVNLARHAAEAAVEVKQSTLEMGLRLRDLHRSKEKPKNLMLRDQVESPLAALRRRFGDTHGKLRLSPEQEEHAVTIQLDLFDEQVQEFKEKVASVESQKGELQRLMLASDACHRKELSEDEYRSLLAATDEEMREALMPPDENRLGMASPFSHREFEPRFLALLDGKQKEVFEQAPEGFYLDDDDKREKAPADPPAMSLESRERKLTAFKKVIRITSEMLKD